MSFLAEARRNLETPALPPIPYVSEYEMPLGQDLSSPPPAEDYPGLLFYHLVHSGTSSKLVAHWASKEHYGRQGERFRSAANGQQLLSQGTIERYHFKSKPLWRSVRWYTLVLGIAAFLGALNAIEDHFDWLFEEPYLFREVKRPSQLSFVEGSKIEMVLALTNRSPVPHRDVRVSPAHLRLKSGTAGGKELLPSIDNIRQIPEGESEEISFTGSAPAPGSYELAFEAVAKAGVLRHEKPFPWVRDVEIWPRLPKANLSVKQTQQDLAVLTGTLRVGLAAPRGLDCELLVQRVRGLEFQLLDFKPLDGSARWSKNEDIPGQEAALLRWSSRPIPEFQPVPFQIALQGNPPGGWKSLSRTLQVKCYDR